MRFGMLPAAGNRCWPPTVLLAIVVVACGGGGTSGDGAATRTNSSPTPHEKADAVYSKTTLRVGFASDADFTQIANYKWLRDLEQLDGMQIEEAYFRSSQDSFRALVAGEVDLAFGTLSSGIALVRQGGDPIRAIVSDMKAPDYVMVAQSHVADLQDLEGQRLGISTPGDISDTLTRAVLIREGVDVDAVHFLQIGGTSARMSALMEGQIDAGPAHAADGLAAMAEQDLINLYSYGNTIGDYLQQVVFVRQPWAEERRDLVQHLVNRFMDSVRWAAASRQQYLDLAPEFVEGLDPEVAEQAYDIFTDIEMFAVNGGMSVDLLQNTVRIEQEVGALGDDVPPVDAWADTSFVERYLKEHGEVGG